MDTITTSTSAEWEAGRADLRARLWQLLGDLPPIITPQVKILDRGERDGCIVEHIAFDNGAGATVYGFLLLPPDLKSPAPAILYNHQHGHKYELGKNELFQDWLIEGIMPGPALVKAGYGVLAIDAYCFAERQTQGPAGDAETGAATEQALFKHFLWQGSTLWGRIVRDDLLALNYLLTRPEIDPERVGVTGMSLGGSRTTWLAALDGRPRAIVPVAQMNRYRDFAATGRYNLHSIYYYLPGALKSGIDMEHLVALTAPRAQAILVGGADPLSPLAGIVKIEAFARSIYALYGQESRFEVAIQPGLDHKYTPSMFASMLEFFNHHLKD
ncbi:MAG: acetylxylan esterase [Anaerolineae bacterium]|nr:acetylxylan esterase [Anaerolineae bacterium]